MEEDEEDDKQIPSDKNLQVVARYRIKKSWPKSEVFFSKIPDRSVKENRPNDRPDYHTINTERAYNVNTLGEKPHDENHSS